MSDNQDSRKRYAEWLEILSLEKLNNEILKRHDKLMDTIEKAMNILEEGMTSK